MTTRQTGWLQQNIAEEKVKNKVEGNLKNQSNLIKKSKIKLISSPSIRENEFSP